MTPNLIKALEDARGASRELDARIELNRRKFLFGAAAVAGAVVGKLYSPVPIGWIGGLGDQPIKAPEYTTSLDAALTLVPEGAKWSMGTLTTQPGVIVWINDVYGAGHKTPAIALCIAALKARETGR